VAVVELSKKFWLVAGVVPAIDRHPLKKFEANEDRVRARLHHCQHQAIKAEARSSASLFSRLARDGFWLARCLQAPGIEAYVIRSASIAVS